MPATQDDPATAPDPLETLDGLPRAWSARPAEPGDVDALHALLARHETVATGAPVASRDDVEAVLTTDRDAYRHVVVRDGDDEVRGWAKAHDRAAGRVLLAVTVDPDLEDAVADALADDLFAWAVHAAQQLAGSRGLDVTQIDSGAFADDARQQRWLEAAGFEQMRSWFQMVRPTTPEDAGAAPGTHPTLVVRRVRRGGGGLPEERDLVAVHDVLEEAFEDHFNYRTETFDEFLARLREDPGHRWDHWWIAEVVEDGAPPRPAGALVGTVSPGDDGAPDGTYVAYLGVLRSARGRGAARSLLHAVIADAARRGRDRVSLEVDADSPTGAVALYTSTGFRTRYVTQSWHRDVPVPAALTV